MRIANRKFLFFLALAVLAAWAVDGDAFTSYYNLRNVARQNSMIGLTALGMTVVLIAGGIDLSAGGMVAFSSVVTAALSKYGTFPAAAGGLVLGAALGVVNAVLVLRGRIQPFAATLATMMAYRGAAVLITDSQSLPVDRSSSLIFLGRGYFFGVPVPVLVFVSVLLFLHLAVTATRWGRWLFAVGDNAAAAELADIDVPAVKAAAYVVSGTLAGLAGVLTTARMGSGQPSGSNGWELTALAASVIGGAALSGGAGSIAGTALGVLLLGLVSNAITLHGGIGFYWESAVVGVILLAAVALRRLGRAEL